MGLLSNLKKLLRGDADAEPEPSGPSRTGHSIREVPDSPLGPPPRGPPSATAYISYRQAHPAAAAAAPPPGPPPHRPSEADDAVAGAPHGRNGGAASKARGAPQPEYLVALPRLPALDAPTSPSAFLHLHAHPPNAPRSPHSPKTVRHGPPPSPAPASQGHHLPAALVPASPTSATHLGARPSSQLSPGQPGLDARSASMTARSNGPSPLQTSRSIDTSKFLPAISSAGAAAPQQQQHQQLLQHHSLHHSLQRRHTVSVQAAQSHGRLGSPSASSTSMGQALAGKMRRGSLSLSSSLSTITRRRVSLKALLNLSSYDFVPDVDVSLAHEQVDSSEDEEEEEEADQADLELSEADGGLDPSFQCTRTAPSILRSRLSSMMGQVSNPGAASDAAPPPPKLLQSGGVAVRLSTRASHNAPPPSGVPLSPSTSVFATHQMRGVLAAARGSADSSQAAAQLQQERASQGSTALPSESVLSAQDSSAKLAAPPSVSSDVAAGGGGGGGAAAAAFAQGGSVFAAAAHQQHEHLRKGVGGVGGAVASPCSTMDVEDLLSTQGAASVAPEVVTKPSNVLAVGPALPRGMRRSLWSVRDFTLGRCLHKGYASHVYSGECKLTQSKVVLKVYRLSAQCDLQRVQLYREICVHSRLEHQNVVAFYAAFLEDNCVVIVQEFAAGGDLLRYITKQGGKLSERQAVHMVLQPFLQALLFLHTQGIIHRDIKPENCLLTEDKVLKLADFGLAVDLRTERANTRAGTLDYMAPEVLRCPTKETPDQFKTEPGAAHYEMGADAWAVGVFAYELVVGGPPFKAEQMVDTARNIMSGRIAFPPGLSEASVDFISSCLQRHPGDRPTVLEMLRSPWVSMHQRRHSVVVPTMLQALPGSRASGTAAHHHAQQAHHLQHHPHPPASQHRPPLLDARSPAGSSPLGAGSSAGAARLLHASISLTHHVPSGLNPMSGPPAYATAVPAATQQHGLHHRAQPTAGSSPKRGALMTTADEDFFMT